MNAPFAPPATTRRKRPELDIAVERRGPASRLVGRFVTYPFHLTRLFALDAERPEVATLYVQSSSGGLYAGEDLTMRVRVGAGAALHLTTQASTIVQGDRGRPARIRLEIEVENGGFLAYTPDPQILFPGAAVDSRVAVNLIDDAEALIADALLLHDPKGAGGAPLFYRNRVDMRRDGLLVASDRQSVDGTDLARSDGPLHGRRVAGSALWLRRSGTADAAAWEDASGAPGCLAGASLLPEGCGAGLRLLATDGAAYQRAMESAFTHVFATRFGIAPAPRRK
ncbi:urease accessory protein UreD [Ancylobacter sp. Lp-2]|uniref:urease accessory protein UreD n=1 Tax=Ancylobacter sp. Lp-2 TaxID=2881339 RepID=UPI001E3F2C2D|nr:urease accessory protein UreD [Ancylobacter sp. Lp-2]MCB4767731.1 urease accessory protein UreD [Ancylobacter sp. Lp-2]